MINSISFLLLKHCCLEYTTCLRSIILTKLIIFWCSFQFKLFLNLFDKFYFIPSFIYSIVLYSRKSSYLILRFFHSIVTILPSLFLSNHLIYQPLTPHSDFSFISGIFSKFQSIFLSLAFLCKNVDVRCSFWRKHTTIHNLNVSQLHIMNDNFELKILKIQVKSYYYNLLSHVNLYPNDIS